MTLYFFTVFDKPVDYPDKVVVRKFEVIEVNVEATPTDDVVFCNSIDEARASVPPGLYCVKRHPDDDVSVVETWI